MPRSEEGAVGGAGTGTSGVDKDFCSKPTKGWLHADHIMYNEGVTFNVRVCCVKFIQKKQFFIQNEFINIYIICVYTVHWLP